MYSSYGFLGAVTDKYSPDTHPELYDHSKYPDARTGWHWNSTLNRWSLGTGPNDPIGGAYDLGDIGGGSTLLIVGAAAAAYWFFFRKRR